MYKTGDIIICVKEIDSYYSYDSARITAGKKYKVNIKWNEHTIIDDTNEHRKLLWIGFDQCFQVVPRRKFHR